MLVFRDDNKMEANLTFIRVSMFLSLVPVTEQVPYIGS